MARGAKMQSPKTVEKLEDLGRVRLSESFFMRDFLHSEIANIYGIPNVPEHPDIAIEAGQHLCQELLEPLNSTFGRVAIRSGYRSPAVNSRGNTHGHNCASNEKNYASHIWDYRDSEGRLGATACIVIPWFADRYAQGADWRGMAWWIHDHLPYSRITFYPKLAAFNLTWSSQPQRVIKSFIPPKGFLTKPGDPVEREDHSRWYADFPPPCLGGPTHPARQKSNL